MLYEAFFKNLHCIFSQETEFFAPLVTEFSICFVEMKSSVRSTKNGFLFFPYIVLLVHNNVQGRVSNSIVTIKYYD